MKNKTDESRDAARELTEEGLFAYFDQMSDENGQIITTAKWLSEVGMMIQSEAKKAFESQHAGIAHAESQGVAVLNILNDQTLHAYHKLTAIEKLFGIDHESGG